MLLLYREGAERIRKDFLVSLSQRLLLIRRFSDSATTLRIQRTAKHEQIEKSHPTGLAWFEIPPNCLAVICQDPVNDTFRSGK